MFEKLLARIDAALTERDLPYMIIGGQAVLLYGEPRLTRDIDVTLGAGPDRLEDLLGAVTELGFVVLPDDPDEFVERTMVLPVLDEDSGIRVDFIFSFTQYEKEAISRAKHVSIGNRQVAFASVEDLIIHKIFAGRPRDLEDVRSVILKNSSIDMGYIQTWLRRFDDVDEDNRFSQTFKGVLKDLE